MSLRQNAFVAILLAVLAAIAGDWTGLPEAAHLWCLPAALLLLGLWYERVVVRRAGLRLTVRAPARWYLARPASVAFEFAQRLRRALPIEFAPDAPVSLECPKAVQALSIPGGAAAQLAIRAVARRLGRYTWPIIRARVAGPLGLAWWPQPLSDPAALRVEPDVLGGDEALHAAERAGDRTSVRAGVGSEILQLRDYRPGDPLRAIDWKAVARTRRLVARDFAEDQRLDVIVGVDAGRGSATWCGDLDRLGHYVNLSARLAERVIAQDDSFGVVVFGDQPLASLPPTRGTAALIRIRTLLASVEPQRTDSNPIHAAARIRTMVRRRCLVILLTDVDDAASSGQLASAVRLLQPQHLPLVAGIRSAAREQFAQATGADWMSPYRALAAAEHAQRLERAVGALHAAGVTALLTRPEQFESAVVDAYRRFRRQRRV